MFNDPCTQHLSPSGLAPQLRLDQDRADHRLILESPVGALLAEIEPWRLIAPLKSSTRDHYLRRVKQLERFCIDQGVTQALGEAHTLDQVTLETVVERFIGWLLGPVDAAHPLLAVNADPDASAGGWRGSTDPIQAKNVVTSLNWWATMHSRPSPITAAAAELAESGPTLVRQARAMTSEEVCAAALALFDNSVWPQVADPVLLQIIHARELAALNTQVATAHRPGERAMFLDKFVVEDTVEEIVIRFPRTKNNHSGRLINLRPRDDILCPVWALRRFHRLLDQAGLDRGGYLLPGVSTRPTSPIRPPDYSRDRTRWDQLMDHIGVLDAVEVREGRYRASPHCIRATIATRAFEAHWPALDLMGVGGWQSFSSASEYNRGTSAQNELAADMAAQLAVTP
jgi:hypothetical protein